MEPYRQRDHLEYPEMTMFEMVRQAAENAPDMPAYEFFNKKTSYRRFIAKIERTARALLAEGVNAGDAVTICMPNTPQALDAFLRDQPDRGLWPIWSIPSPRSMRSRFISA